MDERSQSSTRRMARRGRQPELERVRRALRGQPSGSLTRAPRELAEVVRSTMRLPAPGSSTSSRR